MGSSSKIDKLATRGELSIDIMPAVFRLTDGTALHSSEHDKLSYLMILLENRVSVAVSSSLFPWVLFV